MKLKYFAWIKNITNCDEEEVVTKEINDLNKLKNFLIIKYPDLNNYVDKKILRFAVNQNYVSDNINLKPKDEIAIFPPVSGG